jgi:prepilin-type N-terminal cleavage/methylation domain-containing protein
MMKKTNEPESLNEKGFSMVELMIAMTVLLILLGLVSTLFSSALGVRARESRRTDALTSARAAINIISREIANSGFGLNFNGIVTGDSNANRLHFRSNISNSNAMTCEPGEDVTYFFDGATNSIVRYDRFPNITLLPTSQCDNSVNIPETSVVVNRISNVTFTYFNYTGSNSTPTQTTTPTVNTGRVRINVTVQLENVQGQPNNQTVTFTSDVTLRNSNYMLLQY